MTIKEWQKEVYELAKSKGWHQSPAEERIPQMLINIHAEISECWEEYRKGKAPTEVYENPDKPGKMEGIGIEIADVVIRSLDTCEALGIDLEAMIKLKHEYNKGRSYRHGGKKA